MTASNALLSRQGQRLLQLGMALILLSSIEGFAIPHFASPRIGLSVHTLSGFVALFLLIMGLIWPRLTLRDRSARIAFWCSLHGNFSILTAYTIAALWGVGLETIQLMGELPHGLSRGTPFQEGVIFVITVTSAPTGLISSALVLWGLRIPEALRQKE